MRVLILGVGNLLLGDEGVGIHVVRRLEGVTWPGHVTVVDGGTGGFHLLSYLAECDVAILIDATLDGQPPGTVRVFEPKYAADYPRSLSAHDIGLKDLVESADLLQQLPRVILVTVSAARIQPMVTTLSPDVERVVPAVADRVRRLAEELVEERRS